MSSWESFGGFAFLSAADVNRVTEGDEQVNVSSRVD